MSYAAIPASFLVSDSITALPADCAGAILLAASHAGAYCGRLAVEARLGGVILHDAGIGRDEAGIAALPLLERVEMPAAAIDYRSARIGDGADCRARGVLSRVNAPAAAAGIRPGMAVEEALSRLSAGVPRIMDWQAAPPVPEETRRLWADAPAGIPVWLLDSNALVKPEDAGTIIVTGSHGGLLGGRPETAVKAQVFAAAYNDAGIGADQAGISRLPALEARGIAGVTVSAASARIGEALSTLEDGIISRFNPTAARHGAKAGLSMRECLRRFGVAWHRRQQQQQEEPA